MTVEQIKNLALACDPTAEHYATSILDGPYTIWRELRQLDFYADNHHAEEAWAFQIDRFSVDESDPTAEHIRQVLEDDDGVAFTYQRDREGTPEAPGLIHHIFSCEG